MDTTAHISRLKKKKHGHLERCKKSIWHNPALWRATNAAIVKFACKMGGEKEGQIWKTDGKVKWLRDGEGIRDKERDATKADKKQESSKWQGQKRDKNVRIWDKIKAERSKKRDHEECKRPLRRLKTDLNIREDFCFPFIKSVFYVAYSSHCSKMEVLTVYVFQYPVS